MRKDLPSFYGVNNVGIAVWMSLSEIALFVETLKKNSNKPYLEFGAGGSTVVAASIVNDVICVDNNKVWLSQMYRNCIDLKLKPPRIHYADQGPIGEWGFPQSLEPVFAEKYSDEVWYKETLTGFKTPGTVFIDGRYRMACLLRTIMHCPLETDILLHDCTREAYKLIVEHFCDVIEIVDELAHLRKKPDILITDQNKHLSAVYADPS